MNSFLIDSDGKYSFLLDEITSDTGLKYSNIKSLRILNNGTFNKDFLPLAVAMAEVGETGTSFVYFNIENLSERAYNAITELFDTADQSKDKESNSTETLVKKLVEEVSTITSIPVSSLESISITSDTSEYILNLEIILWGNVVPFGLGIPFDSLSKELTGFIKSQITGKTNDTENQDNHYFKDLTSLPPHKLEKFDLYQLCDVFDVDDPSGCIHHALKKILFKGERGVKGEVQDVQEAVRSLKRWIEINS